MMHGNKQTAFGRFGYQSLLGRIADVDEAGRNHQVQTQAQHGFKDGSDHVGMHHLAVVAVVNIALPAAVFPLGEQVFVVNKAPAEFKRRFVLHDAYFVPGQSILFLRFQSAPVVGRAHAQILFSEMVDAEHRSPLVATGNYQVMLLINHQVLHHVGLPLSAQRVQVGV